MGHLRSFRSLRRYCPDQVRWVSVTPLSPNGHPNGFAAMLAAAPEPSKGDSRAGDPTRQVGCAAGAARDRGADRGAGFMHKRSSPQLKRPPRVSGAPLAPEEFQANVGGFGARRGRRERLLASAAVLRGLPHVAGASSWHGCAVTAWVRTRLASARTCTRHSASGARATSPQATSADVLPLRLSSVMARGTLDAQGARSRPTRSCMSMWRG